MNFKVFVKILKVIKFKSLYKSEMSSWQPRRFQHNALATYNINYSKLLGEGAASRVYEGNYQGIELAIKIVELHPSVLLYERNLRELIVLSREATPYLNYLFDYSIDTATGNIAYVFVRGESLDTYRRNVSDVNKLFMDFVYVLQSNAFLQSKNIVHRDIKPQNILYRSNYLYLTDFDLVRVNFCQHTDDLTAPVETIYYRAPEIILQKHYSFGIDTWALGITLLELLTGRLPVYGETADAPRVFRIMVVYLGAQQQDAWLTDNWKYFSRFNLADFYLHYTGPTLDTENIPTEMKQFIRYLLIYDPANRPSVYDALNQPIVNRYFHNLTVDVPFFDNTSKLFTNPSCVDRAKTYNYYPTFNWLAAMNNLTTANADPTASSVSKYTKNNALYYRYMFTQNFTLSNDSRLNMLMLYFVDRLLERGFQLPVQTEMLNYVVIYLTYIADSMRVSKLARELDSILDWRHPEHTQIIEMFKNILYVLDGDLIFTSAYDFWLLQQLSTNADYVGDDSVAAKMYELQRSNLAFIYTPYQLYNMYITDEARLDSMLAEFKQTLGLP